MISLYRIWDIAVKSFALISIILYCNGCVTLTRGSLQNVSIDSSMTNTKIYINNIYQGETPLNIKLMRISNYDVLATKDGYSNSSKIYSKFSDDQGVMILGILDTFCFIIPAMIDYGTGSSYDLIPKSLLINMNNFGPMKEYPDFFKEERSKILEKQNKNNIDQRITYIMNLIDSNIRGEIDYPELIRKLPKKQPDFYYKNLKFEKENIISDIDKNNKDKQDCLEKQSILDSHQQQYQDKGLLSTWDSAHRTYDSMINGCNIYIDKDERILSVLDKIINYYSKNIN